MSTATSTKTTFREKWYGRGIDFAFLLQVHVAETCYSRFTVICQSRRAIWIMSLSARLQTTYRTKRDKHFRVSESANREGTCTRIISWERHQLIWSGFSVWPIKRGTCGTYLGGFTIHGLHKSVGFVCMGCHHRATLWNSLCGPSLSLPPRSQCGPARDALFCLSHIHTRTYENTSMNIVLARPTADRGHLAGFVRDRTTPPNKVRRC